MSDFLRALMSDFLMSDSSAASPENIGWPKVAQPFPGTLYDRHEKKRLLFVATSLKL